MNAYISKAAAVLLVPVMLGTSCFSCLVQATPVSAATIPPPEMRMDQSMHAAHGDACGHTHNQTSFEIRQLQPTDIHLAVIDRPFDTDRAFLFKQRLPIRSSRASPKKNNFLIGTTIKKE